MSTKKVTTKTVAKSSAAAAKKPATKKLASKTPIAKKTITKTSAIKKPRAAKEPRPLKASTVALRPLVYATNEQSFWVSNGEVLNSLVALRDAFALMDEAIYQHHAKPEQNDFAIWVNDVLCDNNCAMSLVTAKTPKSAHTVVVRHLKSYTL